MMNLKSGRSCKKTLKGLKHRAPLYGGQNPLEPPLTQNNWNIEQHICCGYMILTMVLDKM